MTNEEIAIVKALSTRPMREKELKRATSLPSLWPHVGDLKISGLVNAAVYVDWPDDDNKLYFLKP